MPKWTVRGKIEINSNWLETVVKLRTEIKLIKKKESFKLVWSKYF